MTTDGATKEYYGVPLAFSEKRGRFVHINQYREETKTGKFVHDYTSADMNHCMYYVYSYDCMASMYYTFTDLEGDGLTLLKGYAGESKLWFIVNYLLAGPIYYIAFMITAPILALFPMVHPPKYNYQYADLNIFQILWFWYLSILDGYITGFAFMIPSQQPEPDELNNEIAPENFNLLITWYEVSIGFVDPMQWISWIVTVGFNLGVVTWLPWIVIAWLINLRPGV